ncbi:sister chromatid separation protein-like protein [Zopfia rhizophila CBS 207.26]|uniref:Sister chromatid separation protein-like protein n=1 Tax=Zopfia rhizophila CBS 207.26 TaxID=1314779 RepID=A0A6A6EWV4_9PEZI|nr:sister chromatid separation protein-like protein [Zopfia rhizophila CBS 207.26]
MADSYSDEYWYLAPDQDPSKITVPELRNILLKHGVTYPSSAKKPALVGLFNQHIVPQAEKIRKTHARTKRSTRGIEDVPSSQASTTTDYAEDETLLAPPPTTRRTSRRTTRAATEESERAVPVPHGKTPSSAVPNKHARAPDADLDERPAIRRTRKSVTPAVKDESPEPEAWHRHDEESPFTDENPFQSGSSPLALDSKSRDRRRKTMGFEHKEKRKSDAHRRRTAHPNVEQFDEGIVVPTRRTFDVPIAEIQKDEPTEPDALEPGEEFTPEEQLELVRERAKAGKADILPPRRRKRPSKVQGTLKAFSSTLFITALAAFGGIWRQEKFAVGYCDVGQESTSLAGVDIPEWANFVLPSCEPCPPHAYCGPFLETSCESDFILKPHPLSFGGLIPLPPTCEPDSEKTRRITAVADRSVEILRKRRAKYECGELDAEGKHVDCPEIREADLKQEVSSMRRKGMSQEEFEDLWKSAIGEAVEREEVVESVDGERTLTSTSLAELSLSCSIKRSLRQTLERYLWQLVLVFLTVGSGFYGRYSITSSRAMEARAAQLAGNVFDRLANHAALNYQEPGVYPELGISMTQLRDDILRNEFSSSRRQKLWEKVQKKVEHNSNIRAAVREGRSGDVARMWEWIGPVQPIDDGRGSSRRESSRYSLGPAIASSPPDSAPWEMKELKNSAWDEGRPIY